MTRAARPWRLPGTTRFAPIQLPIFLAFGTTLALALAVGGWAVARYFGRVANRQIGSQQAGLARLVASSMDDKITTYLGSLEADARNCPGDVEHDRTAARRWLEDRRGLRAIFENGTFLVLPEGQLLAATPGSRFPEGQSAFIQGQAATGKPGISEAHRSAASGNAEVLMVAPIRDRNGRTRLLLAGAIDLVHDDFLGTISSQHLPDASRLTLFDAQGRILVHADGSRVFSRIDLRRWSDFLGGQGERTGERMNAAGIQTLTTVTRLRSVPWVLAATLPDAEATLSAHQFRRYLQGAVAAAVALALLLTWALSHRLTENLEDLTRQIEGAADLPPGHRVLLRKGNDETGVLVNAFNGLLARLEEKAARLQKAGARSEEEMALARHVLHRLVEPGLAALPASLHMETLQMAWINGDACTYREGPPGLHFGLLCDATGHGLTAGISTLPAIQAFLSMVPRDVPLETMYLEINQRIHQLMPVDRFLCLLLVRLDLRNGSLSVLNAGLPDAILCTPDGRRRPFRSRNLPAGILEGGDPPVAETVAVTTGDRLLAFTDGVLDLLPGGEVAPSLLDGLVACPLQVHRRVIQETLALAIGDQKRLDDASWALWEVPPLLCTRVSPASGYLAPSTAELEEGFRLELAFPPQRHAVRDLLPDMMRLLSGRGLGVQDEQKLALALTEALANAVDHGLLRLDSRLKEQGFEAYEAQRQRRLAALQGGSVRLSVRLRTQGAGPLQELVVEVEDTGTGFDWRAWDPKAAGASPDPSGRGLLLLRALSRDLSFNEQGNRIRFTLPCG